MTRFLPVDEGGRPSSGRSGGAPAQVVVLEGVCRGRVAELTGTELRIGRRPDNDLVLEVGSVSKHHAVVRREGESFSIEDQGSTNGVSVNGHRVPPGVPHPLCHGDTILVSDQLLLFRHSGSFSDKKGMTTIAFDAGRVQEEVEQLLAEVPELKDLGERRASRRPPSS